MSTALVLRAYDLCDEGPSRNFNEDATLVREDLGLFAVADGTGGPGKGDVAAALALRTIENYIGATVRRTHSRPDHDAVGISEQAKRLSQAVHQAHQNLLEGPKAAPHLAGMACTLLAFLLSPRTGEVHIAWVGDCRAYRLRAGHLEQLTDDHTMVRDVLETQPGLSDKVLEKIPRKSVLRALGIAGDLRVSLRSFWLAPGDRFLLCTDGLSSVVPFGELWRSCREPAPASVIASELLSLATSGHTQDNVGLIVIDADVLDSQEDEPTRPNHERPGVDLPLALARSASDFPDEVEPSPDAVTPVEPEVATSDFPEPEEPTTMPHPMAPVVSYSPPTSEFPKVPYAPPRLTFEDDLEEEFAEPESGESWAPRKRS